MKIYVSGPMRGYEEYNFPAFYAAEEVLRTQGHEVVNPARVEEEQYGFDRHVSLEKQDFDMQTTILCDVEAVLDCDAIYLLKGWWHSKGAFAEYAIARWGGKKVRHEARWRGLVELKRLLKKG